MPDSIYSITRRRGEMATLVRVLGVTTEAETGDRVPSYDTRNIRRVVKTPTQYTRLFAANQCGQDIGQTTFLFWTGDVRDIKILTNDDYILWKGEKYQVVNSVIEETALLVTANVVAGQAGQQVISVNVSNSMGIQPEVSGEVT